MEMKTLMPESRVMHLGAFLMPTGHHLSGWRVAGSQPDGAVDVEHYVRAAQTAERGLFDLVFLADHAGISDDELADPEFPRLLWMDPMVVLANVAARTGSIGLVATATTTFQEPYNVARQFATLDLISGGRAGWNVVTSYKEVDAWQYGLSRHVEHELRYERAEEFVDVCAGLWDSWDEDAFPRDPRSGRFHRPGGGRLLNHSGRFFTVRGPLNVGRSPQGRPVLVQAGSSPTGIRLGGRIAEVIFTAQMELEASRQFNERIKSEAGRNGRDPRLPLVLPGIIPVIGKTRAEADDLMDRLNALIDPETAMAALRATLPGVDASGLGHDDLMPDVAPEQAAGDGNQSRQAVILADARRRNLTVLETARMIAGVRGHHFVVGTAADVADRMEEWFTAGACDGFNVMPAVLPAGLETFVAEVVPELQRRGLYRTAYDSSTLRGHLGMDRPAAWVPAAS